MTEMTKPRSVIIGVCCLYLSLLISFVLSLLNGFLIATGTVPLEVNGKLVQISGTGIAVATIVTSVVFAAIWWWVIHKISQGSTLGKNPISAFSLLKYIGLDFFWW